MSFKIFYPAFIFIILPRGPPLLAGDIENMRYKFRD